MDITLLSCAECETAFIPPKYVCPSCQHHQLHERKVAGTGTVYSYTTIYIAPETFAAQVPYHIVLVELDEGLRVTGRVTEGIPSIGQKVECNRIEDSIYWFDLIE